MPSRLFTVAILGFWLATTAWMFYREVWSHITREPPPFTIDLADEVAAQTLSWRLMENDVLIGYAKTSTERNRRDRTFIKQASMHFDETKTNLARRLQIDKATSLYRISPAGELLYLEAAAYLKPELLQTLSGKPLKHEDTSARCFKIAGTVENKVFKPKLIAPEALKSWLSLLPELEPIAVSQQGSIINTMHPLNKIRGLRTGQAWVVPDLNSLSLRPAGLGTPAPSFFRMLNAVVEDDELLYFQEPVRCWRIDYAETGKKPCAQTWVRRSDDTVLQQSAELHGTKLILVRDFKK